MAWDRDMCVSPWNSQGFELFDATVDRVTPRYVAWTPNYMAVDAQFAAYVVADGRWYRFRSPGPFSLDRRAADRWRQFVCE